MNLTNKTSSPIAVQLVGAIEHPDFHYAEELLRSTAQCENPSNVSPEVVIIAQARPGQVRQREVDALRRRYPLAGIVTIAGSWCEGETRTGRPWPGVKRFYWYEFPAWWRQQLARRNAGLCPDWSRPTSEVLRNPAIRNRRSGVILLNAADPHIADTVTDVLHHAGYATIWHPPGRITMVVRGVFAGIWDGGQLDNREVKGLAAFCRTLARDAAPVVAMLDFPRRDRYEVARQFGAAAVLGKPCINADLIATIEALSTRGAGPQSMPHNRAA